MSARASVAVVVASRGRPQELADLVHALSKQTLTPRQVVVSVTQSSDYFAEIGELSGMKVDVLVGPAGSCIQRNRGMDVVHPDVDVIAFLDDDYLPRNDAMEGISLLYSEHPDVVAANGVLVADGAQGPGISLEESSRLLGCSLPTQKRSYSLVPLTALYGCNMTVRRSALSNVRFDERLALYGWQEDIDFTSQLNRFGKIVRCDAIVGVHRGVKGGRVSGRRFGYSQIVNPAYLVQKGTMPFRYAVTIALQNFLANLFRQFRPEPWVDRRGRFVGNCLGILDLIRGRTDPMRVLNL